MPLAPLESPFRAFPSRGAVPALAGLLLPCGFAFDRPTARPCPWVSRPLSPSRRPLAAARPEGSPDSEAGTNGSPEPLDIVRDTQARPGTSLLGSVGLAGLGGRHAHFEALLPSRVRSRDERHPGQGTFVWSVLSWVSCFPSRACSSISRARHARERSCSGWALASVVLGSSAPGIAFCQVRSPAVGPRTHDPLTCSVDRTLHVAVRQRPCSRSPSRWLSRASRQPRPTSFRRDLPVTRWFPGSTIERDVLPAPPLGGAPRLPRPSSALRHEGGHGVDLGDARSRSASRPISREIGQLLWGFAPLRSLS
jgi:hypothetical protein